MIILGIVFIIIGIIYSYKQSWILMFCKLVQTYIFNEKVIILHGKKIGLIFILFGILFIGTKLKSLTRKDYLYTAYKEFYSKNFSSAEKNCQTILQSQPNNADTLFLLGKIYFVTERYFLAKTTFLRVVNLEPSKEKEVEKYLIIINNKIGDKKNEN